MGNLVWESLYNDAEIEGPFLSYWHQQERSFQGGNRLYSTRKFSGWMFGLDTEIKAGRFGSIDSNILETALSVENEQYDKNIEDKKIIENLEKLKTQIEKEEGKLYNALGLKDTNLNKNFKNFLLLWKGESKRVKKDEDLFWINYHLNFLKGQTQKLITGKIGGNSPFLDQILQLVSIELDNCSFVESSYFGLDAKEKSKIRKLISDPKTGKILLDDIMSDTSKRKKKYNEDEIIQAMIEYFDKMGDKIGEQIINNGYYQVSNALKNISNKINNGQYKYKSTNGQIYKTNSINSLFITFNFKNNDLNKNRVIDSIWRELNRFFVSARSAAMPEKDAQVWKTYVLRGGGVKFKRNFQDMLRDFLKNNWIGNPNTFLKRESDILKFFGDLYAYGKSYFNLSKISTDINLLWTNSLLSEQTNKKLSYDMVLSINKDQYGIKAINPYGLENGLYQTHQDKQNLSDNNIYNQLNINNEYQKQCFQQLNLNLNSPTRSDQLRHAIESFLYLHSGNFIKLEEDNIKENMLKEEVKEQMSNGIISARNIFFVLRGEIFPSRLILYGLIEQYKYLLGYRKAYNHKQKFHLKYVNNIQIPEIPTDDSTRQVQLEYVTQGSQIKNLLKQITISTSLTLVIPSIDTLIKLRW